MTLMELLPTIHSLPRADKHRLIQLLAGEVAQEEGVALDLASKAIPVWSQYEAFEGAATLLRILDEEKVGFKSSTN